LPSTASGIELHRHTANPAPPLVQRPQARYIPPRIHCLAEVSSPLSCPQQQESRKRSSQFVLVGVSPPRPHEPLHARSIPGDIKFSFWGVTVFTELHLHNYVHVQRHRLHEAALFVEDGTLIPNCFDDYYPTAEPGHATDRIVVS